MQNPGFDILKKAFKKAVDELKAGDLQGRVTRSAATGAKAGIERGLQEFPQADIENFVNVVYKFVASQDVADGISTVARSVDASEVQGFMDQFVDQISEDEGARQIAKMIKQALKKTSPQEMQESIESKIEEMPLPQQMMLRMLTSQIIPQLEEMSNMSEEQVAEAVKQMAKQIPTDQIAMYVHSLAQNVTPQRVGAVTHNLTADLPAGETVSDVVHGVGKAAIKQLGRAADPARADAPASLNEFMAEAQGIVGMAKRKDATSKSTLKPKKGKGFDFDDM